MFTQLNFICRMAPSKRLQIFVSSTYTDLIDERQAAVQAILTAGHIPAGMELFSAGNISQWEIIKKWIESSDVYIIIIGGRYGSIDLGTGKSYTHMEFDYAKSLGKEMLALVINDDLLNDKITKLKKDALEMQSQREFALFKQEVTSKYVKFFSSIRDIEYEIMKWALSLKDITSLIGWVPGDQKVDTTEMAIELARLGKENAELKIAASKREIADANYNGLTYSQLLSVFNTKYDRDILPKYLKEIMEKKNPILYSKKELTLAEIFLIHSGADSIYRDQHMTDIYIIFERYGLIEKGMFKESSFRYFKTALGNTFINRYDYDTNYNHWKV